MNAETFKQVQTDFAAYIRNPEKSEKPANIEQRRLNVYSELFYNNVESFIASGFPVLRSLYTDDAWHEMIRDYFSRHRAKTPHFPEMAQEFIDYLNSEFEPRDFDPPFILELAHYEWVESAVMLSAADINDVKCNPNGDLLDEQPVISPLAWRLSYHWPVHEISVDNMPDEAPDQPTFIIVYRSREDEVGFMQINPVTARLLNLLDDESNPMTGRQALQHIADELKHPQPESIIQGGLDTLRQLRKKDIIPGTRLVQQD
ncbi:MAG: DUF2063 domain-containing protein [Gammaproteobacteria bacterium]|nr:MAG: DUF2063 domain-containing protein [Gammaproteobacteria bacterium]